MARLFEYVEITTKIASHIPFFITLAYCFFLKSAINIKGTVLFFIAMLLFDLSVTMINNYIDDRETGAHKYFSRPVMLAMIVIGVVPSAAIGLYLSSIFGLEFFLAGVFCFAAGVFYTYGPAPISRSPYGEIVSGLTQGFVLPYLITAINAPGLVVITLDGWNAAVSLDLRGILMFGLASAPMIFCISNIMLANNIRDIETDKSSRYTMVRHIGRKNALHLFSLLYIAVYVLLIAACILGAIPWVCILVLLTAIPVFRNVRRFHESCQKPETFLLAIRNFMLILAPYMVCMFIGALLRILA
ncbi:MAG: UbiA family prenyltransferase [Treponema sp.]|nr:UbiA family prenyltransferase [Treponema sp.]